MGKVINYFYNNQKKCTKICDDAEYLIWLDLDTRCGHKITFTEGGYDCYIRE